MKNTSVKKNAQSNYLVVIHVKKPVSLLALLSAHRRSLIPVTKDIILISYDALKQKMIHNVINCVSRNWPVVIHAQINVMKNALKSAVWK